MVHEYAILVMKSEKDLEEKKLKLHGMKVVRVEETSPELAMSLGIIPTEDVIRRFPFTCVLIAQGTKEQYLKYCCGPQIDSYWCA